MDYILSLIGPMAAGTMVTLQMFFITIVLSLPLGLALAIARISRFSVLSGAVGVYIWLMRGTPLMLQLLFVYYGLPFIPYVGVTLPEFPAAAVAFVRKPIGIHHHNGNDLTIWIVYWEQPSRHRCASHIHSMHLASIGFAHQCAPNLGLIGAAD